jgi:hypothetical protein
VIAIAVDLYLAITPTTMYVRSQLLRQSVSQAGKVEDSSAINMFRTARRGIQLKATVFRE